MIPQAHIVAWRQFAPWVSDAQVEQDLIISRALAAIFEHDVLAKQLSFRGGTALHKLYCKPAQRYSEDIDLVQIKAGPIGAILDALQEKLNDKIKHPGFSSDLKPLLSANVNYDNKEAFELVRRGILSRL